MRHFSLVVVSWNSARELRGLLASLDRTLAGSCELVLVDNASEDGSADLVEAWPGQATVIRLAENSGFGAASNVGVRAAREDVVCLLNPDTLLVDDSLVALARLARETGALCGPELVGEDGRRQPSASPPPASWEVGLDAVFPGALMPSWLQRRCEPWRSTTTVEVGWLCGACVAARRSVLLRLGPFDERIHLYAEDMDLGLRARQAGVRSLFAPEVARVVHLGDRSSSRRFADAGLALSIGNRRTVVSRRCGDWRERYDHAAQLAYHALRYSVKTVLGRNAGRERAWLETAAQLARGEPARR